MWYAVQVRNGREEKVVIQCGKLIEEDILKECFLPRFEKMKRYQGRWHKEEELLFPGYVFTISNKPQELQIALRRIPELTRLLGDEASPVALYHEEVEFLLRFGGQGRHVVEVSTGYMEGDQVIIVDGPMAGYEGTISRINRHKRLAVLTVPFFGRNMEVRVGLEIIERRALEDGEGKEDRTAGDGQKETESEERESGKKGSAS